MFALFVRLLNGSRVEEIDRLISETFYTLDPACITDFHIQKIMQSLRKVRRAVRSLPGSPLQPDSFNRFDQEDTSMSAMPVNNDLPVSTLQAVMETYLTNIQNSLAGMTVNRPFGQGGVQVGPAWNPRRVEGVVEGGSYCYELAPGVMWHPARGIRVMPYADTNIKAKLLADFPELRHTL